MMKKKNMCKNLVKISLVTTLVTGASFSFTNTLSAQESMISQGSVNKWETRIGNNTLDQDYSIEYSQTALTYDQVVVTITTNSAATTENIGWSVDNSGTIFTKAYTVNTSEKVKFTDSSGNNFSVDVVVANIVNKDNLEKFVDKVTGLDPTKYVEVTWNAFNRVYEDAVEMLKVPHSQSEVDSMYNSLVRAYLSLRTKPEPVLSYEIEYSQTALTYDAVTVTIKTNKAATIKNEGWSVDSSGTVFTKVYQENAIENITLVDNLNMTAVVNIEVENIVNKDALEELVEQLKDLDPALYTEESWNAYYPVYEAAVEMLKVPHPQAEINKMYEDLDQARLELVLITENLTYTLEYSETSLTYDAVTVTITTNHEADIENEGWSVDSTGTVFTKVYQKNSNEEITLTDEYGNSITVMVSVENIVNKDALEELVEQLKDLDPALYTEESWNAYYPVYEAAVEMLKVPHPQAEINKMYEDLDQARLELVLITENLTYTLEYSETSLTYDAVTVTITTNHEADIENEGWSVDSTGTVFTKVYQKNSNEEITLTDEYGNSITVMVKVENIVNKGLLEEFVNKVADLDSSKYSEASWNAYYPVYEAAVEMLQTPHSQDEVDKMYESLIRAYFGLRLIPSSGLVINKM